MKSVCLALALCVPFAVLAQTPNPWEGTWKVAFKTERSTDRDGTSGCQDNTMRLKPTDANTLEGTFQTRPFKMTKSN